MRILVTGASSFTGYWFVKELKAAGHAIIAPLSGPVRSGNDVRDQRVKRLRALCRIVPNCPFGSPEFLNQLQDAKNIDVFCHHGAQTTNYKSAEFDEVVALAANTRNGRQVCKMLQTAGCKAVVLTGSVFEQGEGDRPHSSAAVTNYGLSKTLTAVSWAHLAQEHALSLIRFVIANPFGPFEEPRFTSYLIKTWAAGDTATVNTPDYIRDNIPISLLARHYSRIVQYAGSADLCKDSRPSYFVEKQGDFADRFAMELRARLKLPCRLARKEQTMFSEPRMRVNSDRLKPADYDWNEAEFWDELAAYYRQYVINRESLPLS